ncbi:hypothetical protein LCGC14_2605790, partial [marine sediment metagenome]
GLSDRAAVMSRLRKAWGDLSNNEQARFFALSARVLNQVGQTSKENRYGVGGPQELFADITAVSNLQGDDRIPPTLLAAMGSDDERSLGFIDHQLVRQEQTDATLNRKLDTPSLGEMAGVGEPPPIPRVLPEEAYKWKLISVGPPVGPRQWKWVQVDDIPEAAKPGSQTRFEQLLDDGLTRYERTYGQVAEFGSDAYESAESAAMDAWKEEHDYDENDVAILGGQGAFSKAAELAIPGSGGLFGAPDNKRDDEVLDESRKTREEVIIEASGAESQYDRLLTDVDDFLTDEFVHGGVPLEGGAKMGVGEKKAREISIEVRNEYIKDLEDEIREELGDQAQDQEVREYLFASLNMGKYLEEILLSFGFPMGEGIVPPTSAVAEAERRHLADIEGMYGGFPTQPGLLARVMNTWNKKWIPSLDPAQGFKPTLASLEDMHRGGQVFADPVARGFLGTLAGGARLLEET